MLISEFSSMYYATPSQVTAVGGPATNADLDGLWSAHALIVGAQIEGFRYAGVTGISPWNTVWYAMRQIAVRPGTRIAATVLADRAEAAPDRQVGIHAEPPFRARPAGVGAQPDPRRRGEGDAADRGVGHRLPTPSAAAR
jgi:hypothetical protein